MSIELENIFSDVSQKAFLNNSSNKQKSIDLLAVQSEAEHHTVVRCAGDVDAIVFSIVLDHACTGGNVELIAVDTDLLIMLVSFLNSLMGQTTMNSETTRKHRAIERDIDNIAKCIGYVRKYLTLVHAFSGCDTNSAVQYMAKVDCQYQTFREIQSWQFAKL